VNWRNTREFLLILCMGCLPRMNRKRFFSMKSKHYIDSVREQLTPLLEHLGEGMFFLGEKIPEKSRIITIKINGFEFWCFAALYCSLDLVIFFLANAKVLCLFIVIRFC
jgi:hypothetical protein